MTTNELDAIEARLDAHGSAFDAWGNWLDEAVLEDSVALLAEVRRLRTALGLDGEAVEAT